MKKLLVLVSVLVLLSGCESEEKVTSDIQKLKKERKVLMVQNTDISDMNFQLLQKGEKLHGIVEELDIYVSQEREPVYILTLELKQSHFSLDIGKHIKDEMNVIEFNLPVSYEFYHSVHVGQNLVDEFRAGSFLMKGSFGSWKMRVTGKEFK